jgi:hypothetical protein
VVISEAKAFVTSRPLFGERPGEVSPYLYRTIDIQDVIKTEPLRDENPGRHLLKPVTLYARPHSRCLNHSCYSVEYYIMLGPLGAVDA